MPTPILYITAKLHLHGDECIAFFDTTITGRPVSFLVDTGAQMTILRGRTVLPNTKFYPNNGASLSGIEPNGGQSYRSAGLAFGTIICQNILFDSEFHLVRDDFQLNVDGIIGSDFLRKYRAVIDFGKSILRLYLPPETPIPNNQIFESIQDVGTAVGRDAIKSPTSEKSGTVSEAEPNRVSEPVGSIPTKNEMIENVDKGCKKVGNVNVLDYDRIDVVDSEFVDSTHSNSNFNTHPKIVQNKVAEDFDVWNARTKIELGESINDTNFLDYPIPADERVSERYSGFNRVERILKIINLTHCGELERQISIGLVRQYSDIFHLEGDQLTFTDVVEHRIDLKPGTRPMFVKPYRIPEGNRAEMNRQLDELEAMGIIEPSQSEWNFPLLLVPKKENARGEKQHRLVVDFRRLNDVTEIQRFPIPVIDEIMEVLDKSRYFTTLDIQSAFHQIMVRESDREYLSFQTNYRKMQYVRMPFGLTNSPRTWQRGINKVLHDVLGENVAVYLDDVLGHTPEVEPHRKVLIEIFDRMRKHNIKLNPEKVKFFANEVAYLGYIVSGEGIKTDPKKTDSIRNFPTPQNVTQVQSFLGLANYYRRFVAQFSDIARPMYRLTKKEVIFNWNDDCVKAFERLKEILTSKIVLAHPDFTRQMIVTCDASGYGLGATLGQIDPITNRERPISFISRLLRKAELNYSTIEKELLSVVWAIESFRHYLYASPIKFLVVTDHKPLEYMLSLKKPGSRLYRFRTKIMEYQFVIQHRPGRLNTVADALSRANGPTENTARVSRIQISNPVTIMELFERTCSPNVSAVTRRAHRQRLEELQLKTQNSDHQDETKPESLFVIFENVNTLIDVMDFDRAYYFFPTVNCQMRRRLESKLKIEINIGDDVEPYQILSIDDDRSFVVYPDVCRSESQVEITRQVLERICEESQNDLLESIAMNIEMPDVVSYFNFKQVAQKVFRFASIAVTFYLNKVIAVTAVEDVQQILEAYHRSLLGGHAGFARTKNRIRKYYHWPTMNSDIKKFCQECPVCEQSKINRHTRAPMQVRTLASTPFEHLYMDLVGPIRLQNVNGYTYVFTCECELTKFAMATPLVDATAFSTARAFVNEVVLRYQLPKEITSDNGTNFTSELFAQVTKLLNIHHIFSTPYNPKANIVERYHRSMSQFLRAFVQEHPENWDEFIPFAVHCYNNTPHTTTGYAPQELLFGFAAEIPVNLTRNPTPIYNYDSYISELRFRLQHSYKRARENLTRRSLENKKYYDKKVNDAKFELGDLVNHLKEKRDHKFDRPYDGPWRVTKKLSPVSVEITNESGVTKRAHVDSLKPARANYDVKI